MLKQWLHTLVKILTEPLSSKVTWKFWGVPFTFQTAEPVCFNLSSYCNPLKLREAIPNSLRWKHQAGWSRQEEGSKGGWSCRERGQELNMNKESKRNIGDSHCWINQQCASGKKKKPEGRCWGFAKPQGLQMEQLRECQRLFPGCFRWRRQLIR